MPIRGPWSGRAANGGGGGLAAVAHDATLRGTGAASSPLGLAADEVARIDAAHDIHRITLASWTVTVGADADERGFGLKVENSGSGEPSIDYGAISPQPPTLAYGGERWRIAGVSQEVADGDVVLSLAAPWGARRITDAAWGAPQPNRFYRLGGVSIPASANRRGDFVFRFPGGPADGVTVPMATIAALDAAAAAGAAATDDTAHDVVSAGVTYRIGRVGLDVYLARSAAVAAEAISIDLPTTTGALPADLPAEIDLRIGGLTLRSRDARRETVARFDANSQLVTEGQRLLVWDGAAQAIGATGASTEIELLGRTADTDRLLPSDPTDGQIARFDATRGEWEAVDLGGAQGQQQPGQQQSGATLDSLIGSRSAVALTQAQARLDMNSAGGAATARTTAVALPAAAQAGDRLVARWAWVSRPGAARLGLLTIGLRDVTGARDLDAIWPIWDADAGILSWPLPAGCASVQFVGRFDPPGATVAHATIDLSGVEHHAGAQAISRYVEGRARRVASLAASQAAERAIAHADEGDALNALATDATVASVVRTARWARAWIRAADQAAALAGVGAATWTNQGAGTAPTGAHWDVGDVPAGANSLWELTALVSPTAGSNSAWEFGTWAALEITSVNTQFSVDGATAWHAVRAPADRYERHRQVGAAWGAAIALYAADELVWTRLLAQTAIHQTSHAQTALWELPSTVDLRALDLMRIRLAASTSVPVAEGDRIVRPDYLVAADYASRSGSVGGHFVWQLRLGAKGLGIVKGQYNMGSGTAGDASDVGLELSWHRPSGVSSATDARYLRLRWLRTLAVSHRLTIEAI